MTKNKDKKFKEKVIKTAKKVYPEVEAQIDKAYPKDDSLPNRRLTSHALPKVELERLEHAKNYWANRDDLDKVMISVDYCRSVYQTKIGGFSYDGPKVHFNDCYTYNHSLSLDIEGRLRESDFKRLSSLTKFNSEEFAWSEVFIDLLSHQKCDNIWFDTHGFESDHIGKARLFRSGPADRRLLNLQCWVTVPDYVVRMQNMSLDNYIDVVLHIERFTKVADSLETSEEKKIFQMFVFHNRPSENTKHRIAKQLKEIDLDKTPFIDKSLNRTIN